MSRAVGYNAKWTLTEKVDVNGPNTAPLWKLLKGNGGDVRWNFFTKFLLSCGAQSCEVTRFEEPEPSKLRKHIESALQSQRGGEL